MKIVFSKKKQVLDINLSDRFIYDHCINFIEELGNNNAKKVMIDGSQLLNTDLSYKMRYDIGNIASQFLKKDVKYVVVWAKRDINYFAISIMRINGLNVRIFTKKSDARKWLLNT